MDDFDNIVRLGTFSADNAVIDGSPRTMAEATRMAVKAALNGLLANGYITIVPVDQRPEWYTPTKRLEVAS